MHLLLINQEHCLKLLRGNFFRKMRNLKKKSADSKSRFYYLVFLSIKIFEIFIYWGITLKYFLFCEFLHFLTIYNFFSKHKHFYKWVRESYLFYFFLNKSSFTLYTLILVNLDRNEYCLYKIKGLELQCQNIFATNFI